MSGVLPSSQLGGRKYYVSFIDDYSKFTWVYLLKFKSEVFHKFLGFQKLVECMYVRKIIAMQTDWGGQYKKIHSFGKASISYHVSCPHTYPRNGSTEGKHHHIVEVGLALLAQASIPLKFWDETSVSTVYLINRTPSRISSMSLPSNISLISSLIIIPCESLGVLVGPTYTPIYNAHKLQFRSKQCTFLWHSILHKEFKCLDPATGSVYIS